MQGAAFSLESSDRRLGDGSALRVQKPQPVAQPEVLRVGTAGRVDKLRPAGAGSGGSLGHPGTEELVAEQLPIGPAAQEIGECSAHVDPELPAAGRGGRFSRDSGLPGHGDSP